MKTKTTLAAVLSTFLFLGAQCGTADLANLIAQVQAGTRQACQFVPTAETISAIFFAGNAALQTAAAITDAICASVKPQAPTGKLDQVVTVAGVPVVGHFVR